MTRYVCEICMNFGINPAFESSESQEVGQHIWDDHEENDRNDFLTIYGGGWRILE